MSVQSSELPQLVDNAIAEFLAAKSAELLQISPELAKVGAVAQEFAAGGKRLRPTFCLWGYLAAAVPADPLPLVRMAASLDLLHLAELVHDDVMDASDTRRGLPAAHRQFSALHATNQWSGSTESFGYNAAILLGDLLSKWSVELAETAGFDGASWQQAMPLLQQVRTEVSAGQFLDIRLQAQDPRLARTQRAVVKQAIEAVVEFKTAKYSVIRPLQIGAALASADLTLLESLGRFGSTVGRGFQYRDDLLGVFGDPKVTGKPAGDDLREGKLTLLVATAMSLANETDAALLANLLGRAEISVSEIVIAQRIIQDSGAAAAIEDEIQTCLKNSLQVLRETPNIRPEARAALADLAQVCLYRDH